jgi:hypothetical protein
MTLSYVEERGTTRCLLEIGTKTAANIALYNELYLILFSKILYELGTS